MSDVERVLLVRLARMRLPAMSALVSAIAATIFFGALTMRAGPALAGGGNGGFSFFSCNGGTGGADNQNGANGGNGDPSELGAGCGGGGGGASATGTTGGNGGQGWAGAAGGTGGAAGGAAGTAGGNGMAGAPGVNNGDGSGGGGGGGGGANGLTQAGSATITTASTGGAGGNGGDGGSVPVPINAPSINASNGGGAGGGGAGGHGLVITGAGTSNSNSSAIMGGNGGNGGAGGNGSPVTAEGGNGGNAGDGGDGVRFTAGGASLTNGGAVTGGNGGIGGAGGVGTDFVLSGNGGNGGAGGASVDFTAAGAALTNSGGTITGGNGGNGGSGGAGGNSGDGGLSGGNSGSGGAGGAGVITSGGASLTNSGTITGGNGGNGVAGTAGSIGEVPGPGGIGVVSVGLPGSNGGNGGAGGTGAFLAGGASLTNSGTITGGNGGTGGTGGAGALGSPNGVNGSTGAGGVGITGLGLTIVNTGTGVIAGGLSGAGAQSNAIVFTGGTNSLEIRAGSTIIGNVVGTGNDSFHLGGTINASFNLSSVTGSTGGANQYQGFSTADLNGASIWTVSGTASEIAWTVGSTSTLNIAGGTSATFSNLLTNNGTITVQSTGTLSPVGTITNNSGATITNNGTIFQDLVINVASNAGSIVNNSGATWTGNFINNTGTITNAGIWNGDIAFTNTGTINNNSPGVWTGWLNANTGVINNAGTWTTPYGGFHNSAGGTVNQTAGTIDATLGGFSNSGIVNASGGAINGAIANNAGTFNVGGTVTSNSTFTNAGGATLAIGASGNYTVTGLATNGGLLTVASGGTLTANGGVTNNSGATITNNGTISDALINGGTVNNNSAYNANVANTGTINNNSGTWTGNLTSNTGTVTNAGGATWIGSASNDSDGTLTNTGTWTGSVTNAGMFNNNVGGTVSAGLTNLGGSATNNGTINGTSVINGGTLKGTGTIGNTTINSGGTFAPGSGAAGTSMTVVGNLAFQSGALYQVQISPSAASGANVTGSATLTGASVQAVFAPGSYLTKQYDVLHAAGDLGNTTFIGVSGNLPAGFHERLTYTSTDVLLNLIATLGSGGGLNQTQQSVATGLNNFVNNGGTLPPNFLPVFSLTGSNLTNALTQLSGEANVDGEAATFRQMTQFLSLMLDPFVAGRNGVGGGNGALGFAPEQEADFPSDIALAYDAILKAPPKPATLDQRWTAWGTAYGGSDKTNGDPAVGSNTFTANTYGFAAGMDYHPAPDTILGFALAGGGTNWTLAQALGNGRSDAFQAGVYGTKYFGPAYVAGSLAVANNWMTTNRTALGDQLTASFNAQSVGGRVETGYRYAVQPAIGVTPYGALQAQSFHTPSYSETDLTAGGFGLTYAAMNATDTRGELGARFDGLTTLNGLPLILRGRLAWAHDWVSDPALTAVFQALPGASFVVNGAPLPANSALASAGAELKLNPHLSLLGKFDGEFANGSQTYAGTGALRYTW